MGLSGCSLVATVVNIGVIDTIHILIVLVYLTGCVSKLLRSRLNHCILLLLLLVLLLLMLSCKHIHAWRTHEDWAKMAHILGFAHTILWDAENDAICHHLRIWLLMTLSYSHHLLGSSLLRLSECIIRVLLIYNCDVISRAEDVKTLDT